jgi:hypothetical protein
MTSVYRYFTGKLGTARAEKRRRLDLVFRTCRDCLTMSVDGGKADMPPHGRDFRF